MKFCPKCGCELALAEIDGRTRLACPSDACDYVYWDNPTPVVAAIVELGVHDAGAESNDDAASPTCPHLPCTQVPGGGRRQGVVVLARNKSWPEKMYGLVTGFLEKGETPEASILREVQEELGLEGEIAGFVGYYSFFEMNQLILVFHVQARGEIVLGEELADVKLISPEKLRPWPIGTGPAVRDWLEARKRE